MKKFVTALLCVCTLALSVFGLVACKDDVVGQSTVNLAAITGEQVGMMDGVDYYVVPEPAASAKVKAVSGLNFVGNLQELYGGANGYPQAVIVAKNEILNSSFVDDFVKAVKHNEIWLKDSGTSAETVVNAVSGHLTAGLSPTFNSKNLTKEVIANCGIKFTSATEGKADIISFMEKLNSVSETSFGTPAEVFFHNGTYGQETYGSPISVYAPDGAPALGLASLLAGIDAFEQEVKFEVVNASLIQTFVTGNNPKADICVLPVNLAVKLLGSGEKYKLIGTLTNGNLFIVSKNGARLSKDNLNLLEGKTVGVVNLAAVPGLTFKLILKNNGINFIEVR